MYFSKYQKKKKKKKKKKAIFQYITFKTAALYFRKQSNIFCKHQQET